MLCNFMSVLTNEKYPVNITYVGNEGSLLTANNKKVLVDAYFTRASEWGLIAPTTATLNNIKNAEAPFDSIDLILLTHDHIDHYDPEILGSCLNNNPNAVLVTTLGVRTKLSGSLAFYDDLKDRIYAPEPAWKESMDTSINEINLKIMNIKHHPPDVVTQYGFLFELGGQKILHTGSSNGAFEGEFEPFSLQTLQIDIALLHFYFLFTYNFSNHTIAFKPSGVDFIKQNINPNNIVLQHLYNQNQYKVALDNYIDQIEGINSIFYFEQSLEEKSYDPPPFTNAVKLHSTKQREIIVYPNPTNKKVTIKYNNHFEEATYKILNLSGKILKQGKLEENEIDISSFNKGIYLINIIVDNQVINKKIVIE